MDYVLDHVFICCDPQAPEAGRLRDAGLVEGSGNVHPGQGTANRRFFFDGGFLELLWVHDAHEARAPPAAPTRLWERWQGRRSGACPFGLCLRPAVEGAVAPIPFDHWRYRPGYLLAGRSIAFATGLGLDEPELFAFDWMPRAAPAEPRDHRLPFARLVGASVGRPSMHATSAALARLRASGALQIHASAAPELVLTFDGPHTVELDLRDALGLVLRARPPGLRSVDDGRAAE